MQRRHTIAARGHPGVNVADNRLARWLGSFDWLMLQCTTLVAENGVLGKELARPAAVWLRSTGGWSREPAHTVGLGVLKHYRLSTPENGARTGR